MTSLERIASYLPEWMRASTSRTSNFQRFMNAFALEYDEVKATLDAVSRNYFPDEMNLDEVDWIWKFASPQKPLVIRAGGAVVPEVSSLRKFYQSKTQCFVYDPVYQWVYFRYPAADVTADDVPVELLPHHIWNVFDELALLAGIRRKDAVKDDDGNWRLESNAELKERFLRRFAWVPGPTKEGLLNLAATELGLVHEVDWPQGSDPVTLSNPDPLPHSIRISEADGPVGSFAQPGQWDGSQLHPRIIYFPRKDLETAVSGLVENDQGELALEPGATRGEIFIPATVVPGLLQWTFFTVEGNLNLGNIEVDLIDPDSNQSIKRYQAVAVGERVDITQDQITTPVHIRIKLSRPDSLLPSPVLARFIMEYTHSPCKVSYLYGVDLKVIDSPEFNEAYFNADGSPTKEMIAIVEELLSVVPILWDRFRWDVGYWDVVEKDRMGLLSLPGIWDNIPEGRRWMNGIGDLLDLAPKAIPGEWKIGLHSGFFYLGPGDREPQEYYLFSSPQIVQAYNTHQVVVNAPLISGTPVLVKADNKWLRPVASLEVTEELEVASDGWVYLSYRDVSVESTFGGHTVLEHRDENDVPKLRLAGASPGDRVTGTYRLINAFEVRETDGGFTVTADAVYGTLTVYYEGSKDPYGQTLNIDPAEVPRDGGFIYLREGEGALDDIEITADPEYLIGDGYSYAIITADYFDRDNCPVTPSLTPTLTGKAKNGTTLDNPGEITLVSAVENRQVYLYRTPNLSGSGVEVCTITVRFGEEEAIDLTLIEP